MTEPVPLHGISQTTLMTLYFRAVESRKPDPLVRDPLAEQMVASLGIDFSRYASAQEDQIFTAQRIRIFDRWTRRFLDRNPNGVVVDLACGLDTRFQREDNGSAEWILLDLPEVAALRRRLIPDAPRCRLLEGSVLDFAWMDAIPSGRPLLVTAQGLLVYLPEPDVRRLVLELQRQFPGCEIVFDAMSPAAKWLHNFNPALRREGIHLNWALRAPRELETWSEGIRWLETYGYFDEDLPQTHHLRWMRWIPFMGNGNLILRYRLG